MFQSALSILQNKNNNIIIHKKAEENKEKKNEKDEKTKKKETKVERELNNKIEFYIQKGTVKNTLRSTRNWISKLEVFQYKANTLKVALDSINRYLIKESKIHGVNLHNRYEFPEIHKVLHGKMKDLQERGLGEIHGSQALNTEQVQHILYHESMSIITPENLLYRVFFRMAIIFACRGGEHYHIKADQLQRREDKGFNFIRYSAKNNQRGINRGNAQIISIPADHLGTFGPCYDFQLYLSKRPIGSDKNLYLQVNPKWQESGIWFKKNHYGSNKLSKFMKKICQRTHVSIPENFLSNHSGRKTATQILHDNDIPEQTIMEITGHPVLKKILSTNEINSSNTSQEIQSINFSHEFQSTDSSQEDNSNNIGKENQNKMPIFSNFNPKWQESGIWFKKNHYGSNKLSKFMKKICQRTHVSIPENFLSNHSGRKTATQILHDNDIPEQTIMEITGHPVLKKILSTNEINSSNTSQEIQSINFSHEFQSTDSSQEDNSNNIGKENQNKMPIFSNCNFSNVTFNFK
ncbi:hypothetical protein Glove_151g176 [Diversispora epigaea]|uniref:Tyr recombinase domain-containing protein n=1 Tax=Diversispora epigaea TaxID=1348612 RepID=A0A397ISZ6_9GLOM|nr:hypothetical protein Glove_151g176 [Diversispora epigaea]